AEQSGRPSGRLGVKLNVRQSIELGNHPGRATSTNMHEQDNAQHPGFGGVRRYAAPVWALRPIQLAMLEIDWAHGGGDMPGSDWMPLHGGYLSSPAWFLKVF